MKKLRESIRLLRENFGLFAAITLTVWLPGEIFRYILLNNLVSPDLSEDQLLLLDIRVSSFIEGGFGPIYIGGLLYALFAIKRGETIAYSEAISTGFKNWSRMFITNLVAGIYIVLGFFALIIPGIILALRYSLINAVVINEGYSGLRARQRSVFLTRGRRWKILLELVVTFIVTLLFSIILYTIQGLSRLEDNMIVTIFVNSI